MVVLPRDFYSLASIALQVIETHELAFPPRSGRESFQAIKIIIVYAGDCSHIIIDDQSGTVSSPGYPDSYPKLTNCSWTIKVRDIESNKHDTALQLQQ